MSKVIADQEEIVRIANNLASAKTLLEADLLVNLLTHPARNAIIEIQLLDLIFQLDQLHRDCLIVQQNIFGVEAELSQNHNFLTADITTTLGTLAATAFTAVATGATATSAEQFSSYTSNNLKDLAVKLQMAYSGQQARVRIDLNESRGFRQFTVYIPGLQNLGLPNKNPLDLASSTAEFTGKRNAAENAVREAMRQSQIGSRPTDRVLLVGHSLGGMIASNLANDPKIKVDAVVTFGSPNDKFDVPNNIPQLNIAHDNDPVTWLDGVINHGQKVGSEVQYDFGSQSPDSQTHSWLPSHDMQSYRDTAEKLDSSGNPQLEPIKRALQNALGDGSIETRYYEISRQSNGN